jgi:hypothetical protein
VAANHWKQRTIELAELTEIRKKGEVQNQLICTAQTAMKMGGNEWEELKNAL